MRDGAGEEEDDDDGGGDPEGAVEVGLRVEGVEEGWGEGKEGGAAAVQDRRGVDVEVRPVEGYGPEHVLLLGGVGVGGGGRCVARGEEGG